jgi:hypothetical protein
MTKNNILELIRQHFSNQKHCLIIDKIQPITNNQYGNNVFAWCEIITCFADQRRIIRLIGFDREENLAKNIKIEVISLTLKSPSHPNLGGPFHAKHSVVFHGSMADAENPNEWDSKFLLNILNNLYSFIQQ